jgi:hypothetical protein
LDGLAHQLYYNVEMLFLPHRWFNDYNGLTNVFLVVAVWVAVRHWRGPLGFWSRSLLLTVVFMTIDVPGVGGYFFSRAVHMVAVVTPIVIAGFVAEHAGSRLTGWAVVAVTTLYLVSSHAPLPHVARMHDYAPELLDRLANDEGALVLLEGNPHRDLIVGPERSERTPFDTHFDSMAAEETHRRLYGQTWDGFHWTPFRNQAVAGGAFRGQRLDATPIDAFVAEMRKWGVQHLLVWSQPAKTYLDAAGAYADRRWSSGAWVDYELRNADPRDVVVPAGRGHLTNLSPLGGTVSLEDVHAGDPVVVRANYFPAWTATNGQEAVALRSVDGQLAFDAPRSGTYEVTLVYPARRALILLALMALVAGCVVLLRI